LNINSNEIIANLPALEARELMKKLGRFYNGFSIMDVAKHCNETRQRAQHRIDQLVADKYIEAIKTINGKQRWITSIKGNALSQASAAKRIKRVTANKHYDQFLGRVSEINSSDKFLYQVSKVAVFGSYLTNSPTVGDIDLFVWIEIKGKFKEEFPSIHKQRTKEMELEGRFFRSLDDQLSWPQLDVRKYLKNRSRVISMQAINDGYEYFDCEVVFDINSNISGEKRGTLED